MRKRSPVENRTVTDRQLQNRQQGGGGVAGVGVTAVVTTDNVTIHRDTSGDLGVKNSGIDTDQLADDAVTTAKIDAGAVTETELANDAVTNAKLADMATLTVKSNVTGGDANPSDNTLTAIIDAAIGGTQGQIAYRNATVWTALAPGTSGHFLKTNGAGANPAWAASTGATLFTGLTDTFASYSGRASQMLRVNSGETAVESFTLDTLDTLTINKQFALPGNATATISTNQTDLNPTNLANATRVFLTVSSTIDIYSFAGTGDGRVLFVYNIGTNAAILKKDNGSLGTASMRFILNHDIPLYPGEVVVLCYDAGVSRWRVLPLYGIKIGSGGAEMVHEIDLGSTSTIVLSESNSNGTSTITADLVSNVSLVTGTTHTIGTTDTEVQFKLGAACAVALPSLASLPVGWKCITRDINNNIATNNVTFNADGSELFTSGSGSRIWNGPNNASADLVVADWGGGAKRWYHG